MTERRSDLVDERRLVASRRHTIILTAVLLVIALAGFLSAAGASNVRSAAMPSGLMLYLPILAAELGLLFYVRLGLHKHGTSMRDIISTRPLSISGVITDVLLGAVLLGLWFGLEYILTRWAGPSGAEHTRPLLVRKAWEIPIWILLALTAGFAEEVTFRGYYQRQFGALLRSPAVGSWRAGAFIRTNTRVPRHRARD